jgi:hypothetical protein
MWFTTLTCCAQALLSFSVEGRGPVRFGCPVPTAALERGLALRGAGPARMQWSILQTSPGRDERIWIEVAVLGLEGRARLVLGGDPPVDPAAGPVLRRSAAVRAEPERHVTTETLAWADGSEDRIVRTRLLADADGREAGEALFEDGGAVLGRRARVRVAAAEWRRLGLLPPADGSGRDLRLALREAAERLPPAPGPRGRGDFVRGVDGATITNLEFDTTLGLLRLALAEEDAALLGRAWDAARHLVDVDLDPRSGLPFRHGRDHRSAPPEPGHVWIEGLLGVGCVFADRDLIDSALGIGRALAGRARGRPRPEGPFDRLRDDAWPLSELEGLLAFADLPPLREAADVLAAELLSRWDPAFGCFAYGEAETSNPGVRRDRLWVSLGIAVPALTRHAARTGDARVGPIVAAVRATAMAALLDGRSGVPLQLALGQDGPFDAVRRDEAAEAFLLLDGLDDGQRRRALGRSAVRRALDGALDPRHDDLATRFSIVARSRWVMR